MSPAVSIERAGAVATVIVDRPEVRNAIDPATAAALVAAIQELEADASVHVSVLWSAGGAFCAGADLRAVSQGWEAGRLQPPTGDPADPAGPLGPTRLDLGKPVIAAIAGHAWRAGSSSRCGATCAWPRQRPSLAFSAAAGACHSSTALAAAATDR